MESLQIPELSVPDTIVPVESRHLAAVAAVHMRAFPESALARLGMESVRRYYEWQLKGPHEHFFIGVFDGEKMSGYAVGGKARGALAGFVGKNKWFLLGRIILKPRLLFSARGRKAIGSALQVIRRRRGKKVPPAPAGRISFGILAIAVDPARQGTGEGLRLMRHLESVARDKNYTHMHLTVSVANAKAIRFYEKLGWSKVESDGAWNGSMEKRLS
ncbi:MAG TPA: GNAT family N-acetyltransferase [Verrucomicrobiales bacterium]|nr:GNAT family N-acetyltransferase [Verrucomicrobiales bacterium]